MPTPRVSVCIPTWCGGSYLDAAIRSVLAQTWNDFELVVIDDASPDDTARIIDTHCGDSRVRHLRNPANLGAQGNWNRCLTEARGEFIKVLPHDDLLAPDCLTQQVAALDANPELVLAFCSRNIIGPRGRPILIKRVKWPTGRVPAGALLRRCVRGGTNLIGEPGAVLFRRTTATRIGEFDASIPYVLDLDYWARLLAHGDAWCERSPLASFRISGASWSVEIGRRQSDEFERFIDRMAAAPHVCASNADRVVGRINARLNSLARRAIYAVTIPGEPAR
ncbi:MAG: glycosyltransferase family 2 protein [Azoarcus sp.]|nr:glycosyltransferase family 2 protein [Azoarcus sp.]